MDHRLLKYSLEEGWTNTKIQMWALKLSENNCRAEYLSSKKNTCADLWSQMPKRLEEELVIKESDVKDEVYRIGVIN